MLQIESRNKYQLTDSMNELRVREAEQRAKLHCILHLNNLALCTGKGTMRCSSYYYDRCCFPPFECWVEYIK